MSPILCILDFELQRKHLEKFKENRATKDRRRKSKVFCMYGTVALRSPINFLRPESYSSAAPSTYQRTNSIQKIQYSILHVYLSIYLVETYIKLL